MILARIGPGYFFLHNLLSGECDYQMGEKSYPNNGLKRSIDWKQGLAIALGVPVLVLPSIGYFSSYMGTAAILVWFFSIVQGFLQNTAYGELATLFPEVSGLPGFAQRVFGSADSEGYWKGRLVGGFSAWGYWFAWNPVLAIFSLLSASYLKGLVPSFSVLSETLLALGLGATLFTVLILVNYRGLTGSAVLGYILAGISIVPLVVLSLAPFVTGDFSWLKVTSNFLPGTWTWDGKHLMILLGIFAMAQWSACAWETAAIYGPEYRNPKRDVPLSLFTCGLICLVTFVLVQLACTGTLGVEGILQDPFSPMLPLARKTFGPKGVTVTILMLLAAMVLIMQTAFLGASRAMHSMAVEGNLPSIFGTTNRHGTPLFSMVIIAFFNLGMITLKTPTAILSASAIGYVVANGISLFAFFQARRDSRFRDLPRSFSGPGFWKYIGLGCGLLNIPLFLVGIVALNSFELGWKPTMVGFVVLLTYLPLWAYSQRENRRITIQAATVEEQKSGF